MLRTLTEDVLKSSEIEGEKLDPDQVRSSVARRLGIDIGGLQPADRHVEGVVEMMLDATQHYDQPLTDGTPVRLARGAVPGRAQRHASDHGRRMARRRSGADAGRVRAGRSRARALRSASGRSTRGRDATASSSGSTATRTMEPVLKAALAHLWFVTIHPFDDGNGRIARAIADMSLARSEGSPQRFYSMSAQIREERERLLRHPRTRRRTGRWTSRPGWNGFSAASRARSRVRSTCSPA